MSQSDFVPFRITVCGIEELGAHCAVGVSHVLSIMDPGREPPPAFGSYGEHARLDLRFDDIIEELEGKQAPTLAHVEALLAFGRELEAEGEGSHLLVHCHMGVSRSTASMALILAQARPDRPATEAIEEVFRIRDRAWPNLRILEIGDRLLGRGGELVEAVKPLYRRVGPGNMEFMQFLDQYGRGREVDIALGRV